MKRSLTLLAPALTVLLCAGTSARAQPLPPPLPQYSYNWTPIDSNGALLVSVLADDALGGITFTNESSKTVIGNTAGPATNLRTFSVADASKPEQFNTSGAYALSLVITDTASGKSNDGAHGDPAPLVFKGKLSTPPNDDGTPTGISIGNSIVANTIDFHPQAVTLGSNTYTVAFDPTKFYVQPGGPSSGNSGAIGAHIIVTGGGGIHVAGVPEPSTMVLSCLGGLSFLGAAWRKRRKAAIA